MEADLFWITVDHLLFEKNMKLVQLAEKAGIAYKTILMQRSRRTFPKLDQAAAIAKALDISLDELATGDPVPPGMNSRSYRIGKAAGKASREELFVIEKILGLQEARKHQN